VTVVDANGNTPFDQAGVGTAGIDYSGTTLTVDISQQGESYPEGEVDVTVKVDDSVENTATESWTFEVTGPLVAVESEGVDTQSGRLQYVVENIGDGTVTVTEFSVDATAIDPNTVINDGNNDEFFTTGATTNGFANAPGNGNSFDADGTTYVLVNEKGQNAEIAPADGDVTITFRAFSPQIDPLEYADSAADADVVVTLGLSDGSEATFYFRQP